MTQNKKNLPFVIHLFDLSGFALKSATSLVHFHAAVQPEKINK